MLKKVRILIKIQKHIFKFIHIIGTKNWTGHFERKIGLAVLNEPGHTSTDIPCRYNAIFIQGVLQLMAKRGNCGQKSRIKPNQV